MKLIAFLLFLPLMAVAAGPARTAADFGSCKSTDAARDLLDNFCPRLEGTHLDGCCPPLEKRPPMQCYYHIFQASGQPIRVNSEYTTCVNGTNVRVPCCRTETAGCYTDPVVIPFVPRLLYRNTKCCFETCPGVEYWRNPPNPRSDLTSRHQLTGPGVNGCTPIREECSYGTTDTCQSSDPCPPPPPPPPPPPCTVNCETPPPPPCTVNCDPPPPPPPPQDPPQPPPPPGDPGST